VRGQNCRLTVVVSTLNEEKHLPALLRDLREQTLPVTDYEVIIVDGGSTDATVDVARLHAESTPNTRVYLNPRRWASSGRNIGAAHSRAAHLLFIDAHCRIPSPTMLADVLLVRIPRDGEHGFHGIVNGDSRAT
jgi:glycosyltransferase involved in cell wall biosynthesis